MNDRQNILFIKLCCIGDILFFTPAIQSVRVRFPDAEITMLASTWIKPIVERIPSIDHIIYFDAPQSSEPFLKKMTAAFRMILLLRSKKYSAAVIGHRSLLMKLLAYLSSVKRRIGFGNGLFLTDAVQFDASIHETARYLKLTGILTGPSPVAGAMELATLEDDADYADTFLKENNVTSDTRMIGIFPGGGDNPGTKMHIKRWHAERYVELVKRLYADHGLIPVLIGNASDETVIHPIINGIQNSVPYVNAVNKPNLGQLCGILSRCTIVLGGDSGPVHMAAALGVPTISIFGPSDPRLVAPIGAQHRYIWKQVQCSPCYTPATVKEGKYFKGNEFICITGTHACINEISVDLVYKNVKELLEVIQ